MFNARFIMVLCWALVGFSSANPMTKRKYVDGTQYTLRNMGTVYTQRVSDDGQCSVEINEESKILSEGEVIKIKTKWYKVEGCRLNRAYLVACDSKLFYQLRDLTCSLVHENQEYKGPVQRQADDVLADLFNRSSTSPCCESACTIAEFLQYCS